MSEQEREESKHTDAPESADPNGTVSTSEDSPKTWEERIEEEIQNRSVDLLASDFLDTLPGASDAVKVTAQNGTVYRVKGMVTSQDVQQERMVTNDQIVGELANEIEAPVPEVDLIHVPEMLVQNESQMDHLEPGTAHAMKWIDNVSGKDQDVKYRDKGDNPARFASLAILFGWFGSERDEQFFYKKHDPNRVYSFDHGHFFPDGPEWSPQDLKSAADAEAHPDIVNPCNLTDDDLESAAEHLTNVNDEAIANAVGQVPNEWGIDMDERIVVAKFLAQRRDELISKYVE